MARKFKFRFIQTLKTFVNHKQLNIKSGPLYRMVGTVAVNITLYVSFLDSLFEARDNLISVKAFHDNRIIDFFSSSSYTKQPVEVFPINTFLLLSQSAWTLPSGSLQLASMVTRGDNRVVERHLASTINTCTHFLRCKMVTGTTVRPILYLHTLYFQC